MSTAEVAEATPPASPPDPAAPLASGDDAPFAGGTAPASPRSAAPSPPYYQAAASGSLQNLASPPSASGMAPAPPAPEPTAATAAAVPKPHGFVVPPAPPATPPPRARADPSQHPPAPTSAPVPPRSAVSLEALLREKRTLLASFEAKFNEKILSHHRELVEEQKRSLESKKAAAAAERDGPLAREVQRLKDELEEQKFSHRVELSLQKKKAEMLEEELGRRRERAGATAAEGRVRELEEELKRERRLRIDQLKSLEQLHFAEFREIEKKHAEFVSHLVASYQKEIQVLTTKMPDESEGKASERQEAAATLSSLAAPPAAEGSRSDDRGVSPSTTAEDVDNLALTVATQMPPADQEADVATKSPPAHKRNVSEVSDSGSASGDNAEPERPKKKRGKPLGKSQREKVEGILREAGRKAPPANVIPQPHKKAAKGGEKKMLSERTKRYLRAWMASPEHCDNPYPTSEEKAAIMADTGISFTELNNWFVNNRKRYWQNEVRPRIAEIKRAGGMTGGKAPA